MGQYNKAVLTSAGENLIARTLAGEIQLNITKAKTSNYIYPAGTDFKSLTDMQGIEQTATDPATAVYDDTMIQTRVLFSNEEISSTYYIHNIGLYAVDGTQEVLFCIVTAETPDEMPQYNGVASTSYIYNIQNVVQDADQLSITVNPSGTATIQDVLERVDATGGNISETVIETLDTVEDKYPVPAAGESVKRFFGKMLTFLRNLRPLTGNINIYVSTTGSDTTGDGSSGNPFRTIGHAIDILPKDLGGFIAAINVGAGTYDEDILVSGFKTGRVVFYLMGDAVMRSITVSSSQVVFVSSSTTTRSLTTAYVLVQDVGTLNMWSSIDLTTTGYNIDNTTASDKVSIMVTRNSNIYISGTTTLTGNDGTGVLAANLSRAYIFYITGSGFYVGAWSVTGSIVCFYQNEISATYAKQAQSGCGSFINANGTQISNLITTGLSCTWGTIIGGYVRHGNIAGTAMVTIQISVSLTSVLNIGETYTINGFPKTLIDTSVSCHAYDILDRCHISTNGTIYARVKGMTAIGNILVFNCTYLTF